jgi:hypothetical protein
MPLPDISPTKGHTTMALDPTRRSLRMLAVIGALAALPLLAACNDSEEDDDDDDDDGMARPAVVMVVSQ